MWWVTKLKGKSANCGFTNYVRVKSAFRGLGEKKSSYQNGHLILAIRPLPRKILSNTPMFTVSILK